MPENRASATDSQISVQKTELKAIAEAFHSAPN